MYSRSYSDCSASEKDHKMNDIKIAHSVYMKMTSEAINIAIYLDYDSTDMHMLTSTLLFAAAS